MTNSIVESNNNVTSSSITESDLSKVQLRPISKAEPSSNKPSMNLSILEAIKEGVKLKKIDTTKQESVKPIMRPSLINKHESNFLQNTLSEAIKQRRIELTKNDIEESDESNSDWSD